jgi:uncharacterized membrane protein YebE (DUF533 family)
MERPSKWWRVAAVAYFIINGGGAILAFAMGEQMHGEMHLLLFALGIIGYLVYKAKAQGREPEQPPAELRDPRIDYLQQSVDAVALEVERLGEAQRFQEKLRAEKRPPSDGSPREN